MLQSHSSQMTLDQLQELGLLAPAIELPRAQAVDIAKSAELPASEQMELFCHDGLCVERWKFWFSSLPLSLVFAVAFYLYFTGSPEWLAAAVMLTSFVVFGLAGFLIEQQRLRDFVCPRCQSPIGDWDTNEKQRILFNCTRCESGWDIEYKPFPIRLEPVIPLRRSDCSILCTCRGAVPAPGKFAGR